MVWPRLDGSWEHFGTLLGSWGHLEAILGDLVGSWGALGAVLGHLGASWGCLGGGEGLVLGGVARWYAQML